MPSRYIHYSAPSSLSSAWAVLSRYAAAPDLSTGGEHDALNAAGSSSDANGHDSDEDDSGGEAFQTNSRVGWRSSLLTSHLTPFNQTMGLLPDQDASHRVGTVPIEPDEDTLLAPLIPRIEEHCNRGNVAEASESSRTFREEMVILTKYALPVFGTHLLEASMDIVSAVALGHLSTVALAAATLGNMIAGVSGYSIIEGFASTLDTVFPSAWTSSQPQLVGLWAQRMAVVMTATFVPILCIWWSSESMLLFLKQEPEIARLASVYLKWSSLTLPAYALNTISRRYFESQGLFAVPTRIFLCVAPVNALLNFWLVWSPEPFGLGFIGAPIASAISYNLMALVSIIYGVFFVPTKAWHPLSMRCFTNLGVLLQLGLSGVGQVASEWWCWELIGLAASQLGPTALATQAILLVSGSTTCEAPSALSLAASVRIGNLLGEKNSKRAAVTTQCAIALSLVISAVWSTMFMVFRSSWAHIFNDDPAVVLMVASILPLVALFQVFEGLSTIAAGILRAVGKQFIGALLILSGYYLIGMPFGIWLAFSRGMGLYGLWFGIAVSLVYSAAVGIWICLRTDWDNEVDKVRKRLEADRLSRLSGSVEGLL